MSPGERCAANRVAICAPSCASRPTGSTNCPTSLRDSAAGGRRARRRRADHGPHRSVDGARMGGRGIDLGLHVWARSARSVRHARAGRLQLPLYIRRWRPAAGRDDVAVSPVGQGRRTRAGCCARTCATLARWTASPRTTTWSARPSSSCWMRPASAPQSFSGRMKVGDVLHDPPDGECPPWRRWHGVCRVANP